MLSPSVNMDIKLPTKMNAIKFMDDATCQEIVDINSTLATNRDRSGPLPFWESSGKILPGENSLLQNELINIKKISDEREMVLNAKKTCLFIVNFTKNHQFISLLKIPGEQHYLQVVQETKLLGYWLTNDMKPHKHIEYLLSIANKRMWAISKLKFAGASNCDLKYFFIMKIRSVLESSAVVFHSMLTEDDAKNLERIQKSFCHVLLGHMYNNYEEALEQLDLESLGERRETLCLNFALKCLRNQKFKNLFNRTPPNDHYLINQPRRFLEPQCSTSRYQNSPLVYLTKILNQYFEREPTAI